MRKKQIMSLCKFLFSLLLPFPVCKERVKMNRSAIYFVDRTLSSVWVSVYQSLYRIVVFVSLSFLSPPAPSLLHSTRVSLFVLISVGVSERVALRLFFSFDTLFCSSSSSSSSYQAPMPMPPSMLKVFPVMYAADGSSARYFTSPATSCSILKEMDMCCTRLFCLGLGASEIS